MRLDWTRTSTNTQEFHPTNRQFVAVVQPSLFLRPTCLFIISICFIPAHKRTLVAVRMCTPERGAPPGVRATLTPPIIV